MTRAPAAPAPGHPPSDGAHRLAWWLAADDARWARLAAAAGSPGTIDRLLTGEVEPGDELATAIATVTGGAVRPGDWKCGGPLGWTDQPWGRG